MLFINEGERNVMRLEIQFLEGQSEILKDFPIANKAIKTIQFDKALDPAELPHNL